MGYRSFKDSQGTEWQAWDVVPHLAERRVGERRREAFVTPHFAPAADRRVTDRRVVSGRRSLLSAGLDGGWLCFEAQVEKRRLTPIPADWLKCKPEQLERYCRQAKPALRVVPAVDIARLGESLN
jgi:hypothetical protein